MREIFFRWRAVCTRTWAYKWTLNLICRYTLRCLSRTTHAIASYCASLLACSGHFTGAQRGRRGDRARMRAFPRAHKIECQAWVDTLLTRTVRSYKHRWADSKSLASRTAAQYVYSCRWCRCSQRRPHLRGSPRSILILALSLMRRPLLRHARDTPNRPTNSAAKRSPVASIPSLSNTAGWENASAVAAAAVEVAPSSSWPESSCGAAGAHRLLLLCSKS